MTSSATPAPEPESTRPGTAPSRPLVSFCLLAFNQEEFIREAVEGAFSQSYSPLEIVLSDDCSTDRTFRIMEELAARYAGPHRVVLNRNERNLGIGGHLNLIYHRLARGALLVNAAGDDVSEPDRVMELYEAYVSGPVRPSLLFSNAVCIDGAGRGSTLILDEDLPAVHDRRANAMAGGLSVIGCSAAVDRRLVESFPPMRDAIMAEDVVLTRRAYLRDGVRYVPEPLVRYRVHVGGVSQLVAGKYRRARYVPMQLRWVEDRALRFEQAREDIDLVGPPAGKEMLERLAADERLNDLRRTVLTEGGLRGVRAIFVEARTTGRLPKETVRAFLIRWLDVYRIVEALHTRQRGRAHRPHAGRPR